MGHINIEIKAKSADHDEIRDILKLRNANFRGIDHQIDTYFNVPFGRLKLREGNIETSKMLFFAPYGFKPAARKSIFDSDQKLTLGVLTPSF